jgi:hypothetical protein
LTGPPTLEEVWRGAALPPPADPPRDVLERLTAPDAAWRGVVAWPLEALDERIARLFDTHRLAIALGATAWLERLDEAWRRCPFPVDELRRLRATGEIGLGLGADGWTAEEVEALVGEHFLIPAAPADAAWIAMAAGDRDVAEQLVAQLEDERRGNAATGLDNAALAPGWALGVEPRALRALLGHGV